MPNLFIVEPASSHSTENLLFEARVGNLQVRLLFKLWVWVETNNKSQIFTLRRKMTKNKDAIARARRVIPGTVKGEHEKKIINLRTLTFFNPFKYSTKTFCMFFQRLDDNLNLLELNKLPENLCLLFCLRAISKWLFIAKRRRKIINSEAAKRDVLRNVKTSPQYPFSNMLIDFCLLQISI